MCNVPCDTLLLGALDENDSTHHHRILRALGTTVSRLVAKAGILMASPACIRVINNYGASRGLLTATDMFRTRLRSVGRRTERTKTHMALLTSMQHLVPMPGWFAHPDPLLLLAASISAGCLLVSYYQLNSKDKYQARIMIAATCTSVVFGLLQGYSTLAFTFMILPWVLLFGLLASDVFHTGMRLRQHFGLTNVGYNKGRTLFVEQEKAELE